MWLHFPVVRLYNNHYLWLVRVPVLVLPPVPEDMSDNLMGWFDNSVSVFGSLKEIMLSAFLKRMQRLHDMPKKACDIFWWPFTQHKLVPEETVTVIDSRCGENFSVHKVFCNIHLWVYKSNVIML